MNTRQVEGRRPLLAVYRPLSGLKTFWTTIPTNINDLPATSPHGSRSNISRKCASFSDPHGTRGTAMAHQNSIDSCSSIAFFFLWAPRVVTPAYSRQPIRKKIMKDEHGARRCAIKRWIASARTYRCPAAGSWIPKSGVVSRVSRLLLQVRKSVHGSRREQL